MVVKLHYEQKSMIGLVPVLSSLINISALCTDDNIISTEIIVDQNYILYNTKITLNIISQH